MVMLPNGRKPIGRKIMFKKNVNATCQVEKYKARLVVKEYSQVEGVDFTEIFSPVAMLASTRGLMYLATTFYLGIYHMDVKTTFFHGYLKE